MCGIFGSDSLRGHAEAVSDLQQFQYRGPDHTGFVQLDSVFLGNNRLTVMDVHDRSNQPFYSEDKSVTLVFNGEIYNFRTLRDELVAAGHVFTTESDTEVVLRGYQQCGVNFFARLEGMFALAVYDRKTSRLYLARDEHGIKPLYYVHKLGCGLSFASELKGLVSSVRELRLSTDSFVLATALGYVPSPLTIYEDIYKLEKGSVLTYDVAKKNIDSIQVFTPPSTPVSILKEALEQAVDSHVTADVPVGLFFSGGTDSSLLAALLKQRQRDITAYSIVMDNKSDDAYYTDQIAAQLGLTVVKQVFDLSEFERSVTKTYHLLDEPTLDSSLLALFSLSERAAEDVKVVLSGEGADEFFYGYHRHRSLQALRDLRYPWIVRALSAMPLPWRVQRAAMMRLSRYLGSGYLHYLSTTAKANSLVGWNEATAQFATVHTEPVRLDQAFYLENDLLRKIDLATSYASVEGRVPFLDRSVVQAANKMVSQDGYRSVMGKESLKKLLTSYLDPALVYRSKSGLGLPQSHFFTASKAFQAYLEETLAGLRAQPELAPFVPTVSVRELCYNYPYYAFLLYSYWRSISNLDRVHAGQ